MTSPHTDMAQTQGTGQQITGFHFHTKLDQTILLGRKAKNILEVLEGIRSIPKSSIYYHTHRFLQQHHYLSPEPPNDFAYWISEVLNDVVLGERLSSIDIVQFPSISELRNTFAGIIESHLTSIDKVKDCPRGEEFHFMSCRTFAFPTPYVASNLSEFRETLKRVSVNSLYYHIFDARLRLEKGDNDFSRWFNDLGKKALAEELTRLDPYTHTLEGLRKTILHLVEKYDTN
jgi:hypothetical protein